MTLACASICLAALAATAWHLSVNAAPPTFDDAWYLEVSFRLFEAAKQGPAAFAAEYVSAFRIKAPLLSVLPLPLYALFGPSERLAAWVNLPLLAYVLYGCRRLAALLYGERAGWAAAAACALTPLIYGMSRVFYADLLLAALVLAALVLLANPEPWTARRAAALGGIVGLGLLAKVTFPAYVIGPLWLKRKELAPWAPRAAAVALSVAGTWYAFNAPYVAGFAYSAGFGGIGSVYGVPLVSWRYGPFAEAVSWPLVAAAAALLAAARPAPSRFLAAWVLPPAAALLLGRNGEIRFWLPALPALAVLVGAAAAKRPRLAAAAALPALLVFSAQTFGLPAMHLFSFNGPPRKDAGWDRAAVVAAAEKTGRGVTALAFEHPRLNANNLASWAAQTGSAARFVNLGHAQRSLEAALIRLKDKDARQLAVLEPPPEDLPPLHNAVTAKLTARLAGRKPLDSVTVAPGLELKLYPWNP